MGKGRAVLRRPALDDLLDLVSRDECPCAAAEPGAERRGRQRAGLARQSARARWSREPGCRATRWRPGATRPRARRPAPSRHVRPPRRRQGGSAATRVRTDRASRRGARRLARPRRPRAPSTARVQTDRGPAPRPAMLRHHPCRGATSPAAAARAGTRRCRRRGPHPSSRRPPRSPRSRTRRRRTAAPIARGVPAGTRTARGAPAPRTTSRRDPRCHRTFPRRSRRAAGRSPRRSRRRRHSRPVRWARRWLPAIPPCRQARRPPRAPATPSP